MATRMATGMATSVKNQDTELQLWRTWKEDPSDENLTPLLNSLQPIIDHHTTKMHGNLPKSAIRAQMTSLVIGALPDYDPNKSQLNTYLFNTAGKKLNRYVYTYQNLGSIPEPRIIQIGTFNRVKSNLEGELGRPPTYEEIADEMKVPVRQLQLLEKEMRPDLIQDTLYSNAVFDESTEIDDGIIMLHAELFGPEKSVLEYTYGLYGKPQLSNVEIAKKMGISPSMVTQIKSKISNKLKSSGFLTGY